jgi:hypothetical protein
VDDGLWMGLDETDPAVEQAFADALEAAETDDEIERAMDDYRAAASLRVLHLDGESYADQTIGTYSGAASPLVRFTAAGALLTTGSRHDLYDRNQTWFSALEGGAVAISPLDGWLLHRPDDGGVSLVSADLMDTTPLSLDASVAFTPDDQLMVQDGPWAIQTLDPDTLAESARWAIPPELRAGVERWAVRPDGGQVIVQISEGLGRTLVALDTDTGEGVPLPDMGWGRYNHDGSGYYQTLPDRVRVMDTRTLAVTTVATDGRYGAWLDDSGRWLVVETEDYGLALADLSGSATLSTLDDEGLGRFVVWQDQLWTTGVEGDVRVIHLADGWVEVLDPGCHAVLVALQPNSERIVVRCSEETNDVIVLDPASRAQVALLSLD